jgi:hypothetical protein
MKKLSKEAESRILTALESVADSVNDGSTPTDAIVKAASDHSIPAGHVNLMVSAYNTGRTGKQRMAGSDPFDKAADFELADRSDIMSQLYPTTVKSAAQQHDEKVIDPEYFQAPSFAKHKAAEKVASREIDWKMVEKPAPYSPEPHTAVKRALDTTIYNKRRLEECRREVSSAQDQLAQNFEKLSNYFRRPGGVPFDTACDIVEIQHGGTGRAIMNQISRDVPQFSKEAKHDCKKMHPAETHEKWMAQKKKHEKKSAGLVEVQPDREPWTIVRDCVKLAAAVYDGRRVLQQVHDEVSKKAEETLLPFVPGPGQSVLGLSVPKTTEKQSNLWALSHLFRGATRGISDARRREEADIEDYVEELDNPVHQEDLKAIQIRAQIENMLANDDYIGAQDPTAVSEAYNEIAQLAPRAANSPLLMRNMLRQHLADSGEMEARDINTNILGAEQAIKGTTEVDPELLTAPGAQYMDRLKGTDVSYGDRRRYGEKIEGAAKTTGVFESGLKDMFKHAPKTAPPTP